MKTARVCAWIACVSLASVFALEASFAAEQTNYSGNYSTIATNSSTKAGSMLNVDQSDASLEITKTELGRRTTSRCPLDGSEGDYTSPGGATGKCKAYFKGKYLVIESLVQSRPQPTVPVVRIHTKERWQLSADSKTLTIKTDVSFPDAPAGVSGVLADMTSTTQKYTRVETP